MPARTTSRPGRCLPAAWLLLVTTAVPAAPPAAPAATVPRGALPTRQECERWGTDFADAITRNDTDTANRLIDWDTILAAVTGSVDAPDGFREGFITGGKRGVIQTGLVPQLAQQVQAGGDVSPLPCIERDGTTGIPLRALNEAGLGYLFVTLTKRGDEILATDFYTFATGENLSATLRRFYLMALADESRTPLQRLVGIDGDLVENSDRLKAMSAAMQAGDHRRVLDIEGSLPDSLRREKSVMVTRVTSAAQIDEGEHARALADVRAAFPGDACLDLLDIDFHTLREEHEECLAAIDRLDQQVGGDPYLDVVRARTLLAAGDADRAASLTEKAIEAFPNLLELYWMRITIALNAQKHDDTAAWLDIVAGQFGVEFADLEEVPDYAEFVKSPEYREWKARQGLEAAAPGGR